MLYFSPISPVAYAISETFPEGAIMSTIRMQKALLLVLATGLAAVATTLGVAQAEPSNDSSSAAESGMLSVVEDFVYPNAAQIEAETGAVLKSGDGNLVFRACDGSEDVRIESAYGQELFCFRLIAKPAFLALEIPNAFGIWTTDDPVEATVQKIDGTSTVINAPAGGFTGYGEAGADRERTTLIELRVEG